MNDVLEPPNGHEAIEMTEMSRGERSARHLMHALGVGQLEIRRLSAEEMKVFHVGQRLYSGLYGGRDCTVVTIVGEQSPSSIRSIWNGVGVMGGRANLDIVFDDGTRTMIPESLARASCQWEVFDVAVGKETIAAAIANCVAETKRREEKAAANADRREKERLKHRADNPGLLSKADRPSFGPGRLAAENIRRQLKAAFPTVKFSVKSDYNSVDIKWQNGPTSDQVRAITSKYQAGDFNGMEDIYETNNDATFAQVFGDPKYVFPARSDSIDGVRAAWAKAGRDPAEVPADWDEGGRWKMPNKDIGQHMFDTWSKTAL